MKVMEALEAIEKRRSIRRYTGEPIPRKDLEKIVNAGRLAATGSNKQPWDFIVITERKTIRKFMVASDYVEKAGAVIAVIMDPASKWWKEDGSAAIENMLIASTALGYGAVWLEGSMIKWENEFKELLNVPADRRLLTLIPVGLPAESPEVEKKTLKEVIHWEKY